MGFNKFDFTDILIIAIGAGVIASSAIGIQYYNTCKEWDSTAPPKEQRDSNKQYLIWLIIAAILILLGDIGLMFIGGKGSRQQRLAAKLA